MNFSEPIKAVQSALGFPWMDRDGRAGPQTWGAIYRAIFGHDAPEGFIVLQLIRAVQGALGLEVDGNAWAKTWDAITSRLIPASHGQTLPAAPPPKPAEAAPPAADSLLRVDARSEARIATLHPVVRPLARQFVRAANAKVAPRGLGTIITSATRSYAEQHEIFAKHDGTTHADAGYSNHNFGLAFDVTTFRGDTPVWDGPQYLEIGPLGEALGFTWGHRWQSIDDQPHYELRPAWAKDLSEGAMLAGLRARHSDGRDVLA